MIEAPGGWVSELVSRLEDDLVSQANAGAETSGETAGAAAEDASLPASSPSVGGSGDRGTETAAGTANGADGGGFFEAIFGWLSDLLASIFGEPAGADVIADLPAPGSYVPDPPPDMSQDVVFIEYIPEVPVANAAADAGAAEDDDWDDAALFV